MTAPAWLILLLIWMSAPITIAATFIIRDTLHGRAARRRAARERHPSAQSLDAHTSDAVALLDFDRWEREMKC